MEKEEEEKEEEKEEGVRKAGHSDSKIRCRAPSSTPVAARGKNYRLIIYRNCLHTIPGTFGGIY